MTAAPTAHHPKCPCPDCASLRYVPEFEELSDEQLLNAAPRCTDAGNADVFYQRHGEAFRFAVEWDCWLAWNGKHWARTGAKLDVQRAALRSAREDYVETHGQIRKLEEDLKPILLRGDKDEIAKHDSKIKSKKAMLKWHETSQNAARLNACAEVSRARMPIGTATLDTHPMLFNVQNGTIDLARGSLRPHTRDDFITQISPVEWDEDARCPTWDAFIAQAMGGDTKMVLYLQRLVGYALTADSSEHVLLFFWGGGNNGKGTFFRAIQGIFGEYGCAAPRDLIFQPKGGAQPHPSELARLYGKRMAICAEVGEHQKFDESKIKDLTGGDAIACRRMNEDWWDFTPTHTLFLHGQHKPVVSGHDLGIWRRMRLIPWTFTVPANAVDTELSAKLARELPGILRWAVHGCLEWQRIGLEEPEAVLTATAAYRDESDQLGAFLRTRCVFEENARVTRKDLRNAYERWCHDAGIEPVGGRKLSSRLREHGVSERNVREKMATYDGWAGVRLTTQAEMFATADPASSETIN